MKMQRWIPLLAILLLMQSLLVISLWRERVTTQVHVDGPLLQLDTSQVDRIMINDGAQTQVLKKVSGTWVLPGTFDFPAGQFQVDQLLQSLKALNPGLALASSSEAARRFRVADDLFERHIQLFSSGQLLASLYLGDAAGPRRVYGRKAGDAAIYPLTISAYQAEAKADAWTDKAWLHRDSSLFVGVQLGEIRLIREDDQWQLADLGESEQMDQAAADDLVSRLTHVNFMAVLGRADGLPKGDSLFSYTLTPVSGEPVTFLFTDPGQQGDPLLRVSDADYVVRVASFELQPLQAISREQLLLPPEVTVLTDSIHDSAEQDLPQAVEESVREDETQENSDTPLSPEAIVPAL